MATATATAAMAIAAACLALAAVAPAQSRAAGQSPAPAAQLEGTFQMSGRVTVAHNIRGEHVGDRVTRAWTFTPLCSTGPCKTVRLLRQRATGTDTLVLTAIAPSAYAGNSRFFAPLRCAGRTYRPGQMIPFRVTVHVTAVAGSPAGPVASAITATYVNRSRRNLTPCVSVLGHDAAAYTGAPAPA